ncbi:MAG TPA: hypothetical protein VI113_07515 [Alphaproteobacteria bacterium]
MTNRRIALALAASFSTLCLIAALPPRAIADETVLVRLDNLADLDALAGAHSWQELGDHLSDIPPEKRDSHWESLVEQSAVGELTPYLNASGSIVERLQILDRYYPTYPSLAKSEKFLDLRSKIGLGAFKQCFEAADSGDVDPVACRNYLWDFVIAKPLRLDVATNAAHMVAVKFAQATAAPFFAVATQAPGGEAVCSDPNLGNAVTGGLDQEPAAPEAKGARCLLGKCWDKLQAPVVDAFANESPQSYYMKNACPALMAHQAISGLRAKRCEGLDKEG